jgi:hypothetical protein
VNVNRWFVFLFSELISLLVDVPDLIVHSPTTLALRDNNEIAGSLGPFLQAERINKSEIENKRIFFMISI